MIRPGLLMLSVILITLTPAARAQPAAPPLQQPAGAAQTPSSRPAALSPPAVLPPIATAPSARPAALPPATQPAAAGAAPASQPAGGFRVRVIGERVNVRSRPTTDALIMAQVNRGDVLQAVGLQDGWCRVAPPPNAICFVKTEFIRRTGDSDGVVAVSSGGLRVRAGSYLADIDPAMSDVLALLPNDTPVRIVATEGDWLRIQAPPAACVYVSEQFIERLAGESLTTQPGAAPVPPGALPPIRPATRPAATAPAGQ